MARMMLALMLYFLIVAHKASCHTLSKAFLKSLVKSDFIHVLMILYMYIDPGQGQTNTWGQNFDVNRKLLPLQPFVASLKKISLNSDFMHIF